MKVELTREHFVHKQQHTQNVAIHHRRVHRHFFQEHGLSRSHCSIWL